MLVLQRKRNEVLVIGEGPDQVRVMLVDIRGDKVRIGVEAPRHIPVHREEVARAIELEKSGGSTEAAGPVRRPTKETQDPGRGPF